MVGLLVASQLGARAAARRRPGVRRFATPLLEPPVPRGGDQPVGQQPLRCPWLLHLQPGMQEAKFLVFHARYKPAAGFGRPRPVPVNRGRFWQALVDLLHEVPGVFQVLHLILEAVAAANSPGSRFLKPSFNRVQFSIQLTVQSRLSFQLRFNRASPYLLARGLWYLAISAFFSMSL